MNKKILWSRFSLSGMALATSFFKIERRIKEDTNHLNIMQSARSLFLAALVLISSLIAGCGCLAAQSYAQPACQKYQTYWPFNPGTE